MNDLTTINGGTTMKIMLETITPEIAREYLALNHFKNRPLSKAVIDKYATDMTSGAFQTTHQGIAFNQHGKLVDGQHRLSAIVQSGASVPLVVAHGVVTDDVMGLHVDIGMARSVADIYGLSKRPSSVCSFIARYDIGRHVPKSQMKKYVTAFADDANEICKHVHANIKTVSASQVVSAGLISGKINNNLQQCFDTIDRLTRLDFNAMTPIEQVFVRAAQTGSITARGSDLSLFEKALALFDPSASQNSRLYASEARAAQAKEYIRATVRKAS
jgi:hypothetical protein